MNWLSAYICIENKSRMNFGLLFGAFNKHDVKYIVCGGLAVNLLGVPRMTADIDIILEMVQKNLLRFEQ